MVAVAAAMVLIGDGGFRAIVLCTVMPIEKLKMPVTVPVGRVSVGDIVFVGKHLCRVVVTKQLKPMTWEKGFQNKKIKKPAVWEGIHQKSGKKIKFKVTNVKYKSPMSPLEPTTIPRPQVIGVHDGCGGLVYYSATRKVGDRYCNKCRADGRYGRPRPVLDSEVNPIGRNLSSESSV
jgi:hypothetical protein